MKKVFIIFSLIMGILWNIQHVNDLQAQQVCCPQFILKDAVDVCPPEGACQHDNGTPVGDLRDALTACKESVHVYTVYPNDPSFTYTWTVTGGTPATFTGNPINILWGNGNQGYIKVIISNLNIGGNCLDSIMRPVCLIDGPEADFSMDNDTVCLNTHVQFTNNSLGGSTWHWDFGDGSTSNLATPPPHFYNAPGTYTVTLTVQDMGAGTWVGGAQGEAKVPCGCSDTITKKVVVLNGTGPEIETDCCYGTVCPGDTSYFCSPTVCTNYVWSATGGTILSGQGTNCISVVWNNVYTVPTTVTLSTPGCGSSQCPGSTTMAVPVLYPNLPIIGPTTLCVGSSGSYSLPSMPGTYYNWTVSGGFYTFNQADRNVTTVNITFSTPGSYWVKCEYDNPLAGCDGVDSVNVNVLPVFSIYGNEKVCESDITTFGASGPANWSISPAGPTILAGNGTPSVTITWTPGNYVLTATTLNPTAFCNLTATKNIEVVAKPVLNLIAGADSVCPGKNHTYSVSSNVSGSPFVWSITGGTGNIMSEMGADKDSVIVQFTGSGPWTLSVYQEIEILPGVFCQSPPVTLTVNPFLPPVITGIFTVCVDAIQTYSAGGSNPTGDFQWQITPSNRGTILSGQGTNSVMVQWHGPATTATISVTTCSGSNTKSVTINTPPTASVTYNMLPIFCLGSNQTLILTTPTGAGNTYQWYKNNVAVPGGTSNSLSISIASLTSAGTYQYYVMVTKNGCSIKSNVVNVVIENCTGYPPPPPGGCNVSAYFRTYVVCSQVTLVNQSYAVAPATIATYQWSISGPGTGTFTPNPNVATPGLTVSASGTYTVILTITSSTGCQSTWSETINVLLPTANFTFTTPVCANSPATFTAVPNNPQFNYFWTFGDGSTSYLPVTQHAYATASPPPYSVTLTITNQAGCVATKTQSITVNPLPNCTITASDTTICPGNFATLSACTGNSSYQWYKNGTAISGATSVTYNAFQHGEYWVEVTNGFGCSSKSNKIYIYLLPLPNIEITGDGHVCATPATNVQFPLDATYNVNYIYNWTSNPPGATFTNNNGPYGYTTWVDVLLPAVLPVSMEFIVSVTDITTGCTNADTVCISFYETPALTVPYINQCVGTPVTLTPTPNDPTKYTYQWSNGATTPVIVASAPGFYSLTITDKATGCSATANAGFIHPKPDLSLFPRGCETICGSDTLHLYIPLPLNAQWPNNTYPTAYPSITWYANNNWGSPIGFGKDLYYPASNSGTQQISVVVQNSFGCVDTAGVFCLEDLCCKIVMELMESHPATCIENADGSITVVLDPSSVGGPFTITQVSPAGPSWTILPGVPLVIQNLLPGTYIFTITAADGNCVETYTIDVSYLSKNCCFAAIDPQFTKILVNTTYTTDMVWDGKYYLDDNVILTVTNGAVLDVTNVDVVFGECAGIVFNNGAYLRSTNSVYRPCEIDQTWKGLLFTGSGEFDNIINECTFKNAEVALYFKNEADAVISNNLFSNCNYGVRVENNKNFSHPISGNQFVTEQFFPVFDCQTKYSFVNNFSTYGIYSTSSRFMYQVSQNGFLNSWGTAFPRTYGIYQISGGGIISENTFTDLYSSVFLQSQQYYSGVDNNEIEINVPTAIFPAVYVVATQGPIVEINNNEIANNYNQFVNQAGIYAISTYNISMVNNRIEGFNYGIVSYNNINCQISLNELNNIQTNGIFIWELPNSKSYITCNNIKMKNFNNSVGLFGYNMSALSEISSNCITDCYTSVDLRKWFSSGGNIPLPKVRNNFLYNYNNVGINVQNLSGNIGAAGDPGLNTLWSNKNTAVDINSNSSITVADNFGMFNISWPQVQITSNNPYHSTASCAKQIFNMPSQGQLNVNYICDHFSKLSAPLNGAAGNFWLSGDYQESLKSSSNQFADASMILGTYDDSDLSLLNEIIGITDLSENEKTMLRYNFYYRNGDVENAKSQLNLFSPANADEADFKMLRQIDLGILENGWESLTENDREFLANILDKNPELSNFATSILNNSPDYSDYKLGEYSVEEAVVDGEVRHIENDQSYLNIYPNPASNTAYVELIAGDASGSKIELFDMNGKLVTEYSINFVAGGIELGLQKLREGFYFITLTDPESGFIQKGKLVKVNN